MEKTTIEYTINGDPHGETITISVVSVPDGYTAEIGNGNEYPGGVRATQDDVIEDIEALWGRDRSWHLTRVS